ncbi:ketopantoate reductase family protein [Paenarthrobacter sp. AR 02]|uniref:ketopantoate reductase family protein n=1 Tax=Paenarthrobacter sp. AR 02 TaxID=2899821 RepID=UPI001F26B4F7|nr:ketopantoate reductase family protein [Paenarthrobacter sp. AR 02]MCF3138245.1 ketopantoate reductase family protein [Paenarthrobacter sp. AR 02]
MNILVYGAGGMGLYFSARLTQAGHSVVLKARSSTQDAKLHLFTEVRTETISGVSVVSEIDPVDVDVVLIATKAWQVEDALLELRGKINNGTPLVTLQNGIEAPEIARRIFPASPVIATTCVVIVKRTAPLAVELIGGEATLSAGLFDEVGIDTDIAERVVNAINESSVTATLAQDVQRALWKKIALIASYGGVGAVSGVPVGVTRTHPETRSMVRDGIVEVASVAQAFGVTFTSDDVEEVFSIYTDVFDPSTTSSMQRDLASGLPSELADQNGVIVARAANVGVATPIHSFILNSQLPRERQARLVS